MTTGEYLLQISTLQPGETALSHFKNTQIIIANRNYNMDTQRHTKVQTNSNLEVHTSGTKVLQNKTTKIQLKVDDNELKYISG